MRWADKAHKLLGDREFLQSLEREQYHPVVLVLREPFVLPYKSIPLAIRSEWLRLREDYCRNKESGCSALLKALHLTTRTR